MPDVYCGICGGPWTFQVTSDAPGEGPGGDEEEVDEEVGDLGSDWLADQRVIGDNPQSDTASKIWIDEGGEYLADDMPDTLLGYYFLGTFEAWAVPFHDRCRELLCQYMKIPVSKLSKEVLFETMKSLATDEQSASGLNIDYGDIERPREGGTIVNPWNKKPGEEYFLSDPVHIPELKLLYCDLPLRESMEPENQFYVRNRLHDPFSLLAPELVTMVSSELDIQSIFNARTASPAFANRELDWRFWRARIKRDMPWLWDFPALPISAAQEIDWKEVYRRLYWGSRYNASDDIKIEGLCNRRRIWEQIFPQFYIPFREHLARWNLLGNITPLAHFRAEMADLTQLVKPAVKNLSTRSEALVNDFAELEHASICLQFDWSEDGYLINMHTLISGEMDAYAASLKCETPAHTDYVQIPQDDWLRGFIFTSHTSKREGSPEERRVVGVSVLFGEHFPTEVGVTDGDRIILYAADSWVIVGLRVGCAPDGKLCQLALLQQHRTLVGSSMRIEDNRKQDYFLSGTQILWKNGLPSPDLRLSTIEMPDDWIPTVSRDVEAAELLTYGNSVEELADITSIAVNPNISGFEFTYGHRPTRSMGPNLVDMKRLKIDGAGGERIFKFSVEPENFDRIRVVTNWGRALHVGEGIEEGEHLEVTEYDNDYESNGYTDYAIDNGPCGSTVLLLPCGVLAQWYGNQLKGLAVQGLAEEVLPVSYEEFSTL